MRLLEHPLSSYVQKVKIALREKGIAFEASMPEDFGTGRGDGPLAEMNPRRQVPVLITDGGDEIFDSPVILDYLERAAPEPPLLPADPARVAGARMIEAVCDAQYEAVNWAWGEILWFRRAEGALADRLRDAARRDTATLQAWLAAKLGDGPFFGGARFGHADIAVAPMLNRSVHYGLGPADGSPLAEWHARIRVRPSVAATFAEFDAAAVRMARMSDHYRSGGRRREYRDHRLEWMIRSGGISIVEDGIANADIRFSWPGEG